MSAFRCKADIAEQDENVRVVPQADSSAAARVSSFDHFVSNREHRRRHGKTEHPGRVSIDNQFELRCLHDWQVPWFAGLEDAPRCRRQPDGTRLQFWIRSSLNRLSRGSEIGPLRRGQSILPPVLPLLGRSCCQQTPAQA
jgi:hypothetical protein